MPEVWLQSNRRPFLLTAVVALVVGVICSALGTIFIDTCGVWFWYAAVPASATIAVLAWYAADRPRIAFDGRSLLLGIRNGSPIAVPIELVEAFLLGKGPTYLSGKDDRKTEATTLILRVSERAPEFEKLETNLRLAAWCGHYVTMRGTWTEPLSVDLVNRLNQRLYDAQQAQKRHAATATGPTR